MNRARRASRETNPSALKIQIDGAARGNPGPAGIGVVLLDSQGRRLDERSLFLGESTNNVAESCALIVALQEALRRGCRQVSVETDSELLARQVTGTYRVKDQQLQWLHVLIQHLIEALTSFRIQHIPRSQNRAADRLANRAVSEALLRRPAVRRAKPKPAESFPEPSLFDEA